jgi:hypothetical protein
MGPFSDVNSTLDEIRDCSGPQNSQITLTPLITVVPKRTHSLFRYAANRLVPFPPEWPHGAQHVSLVERECESGFRNVQAPLLSMPISA